MGQLEKKTDLFDKISGLIEQARKKVAFTINEEMVLLYWNISSMLYKRTALSKLPEKTIEMQLEELKDKDKMIPELVFRDPYTALSSFFVIPAKAGIYKLSWKNNTICIF